MNDINPAQRIEGALRDYARGLLTSVQVEGQIIYALTWSDSPELTVTNLPDALPSEVVAALYNETKYLASHDYEKVWGLGPNPPKDWHDPLREERRFRLRRACNVLLQFLSSHDHPNPTS